MRRYDGHQFGSELRIQYGRRRIYNERMCILRHVHAPSAHDAEKKSALKGNKRTPITFPPGMFRCYISWGLDTGHETLKFQGLIRMVKSEKAIAGTARGYATPHAPRENP